MKIVVCGACGRMGSLIIKNVVKEKDMELVGAIEAPNTELEGKDIGETIGIGHVGVKIRGANFLKEVLKDKDPDVLVDFTTPNAAVENIKTASKMGVNLVVGTTGFNEEQMKIIEDCVEKNNIKAVISPNMAVGVNVFFKIIEDLASLLEDYDVEIIEAHHRHKVDAPSGTAMKALEIICDKRGKSKDVAVYGRKGIVGERSDEEIGVHAIRGGDVVGDHTVMFLGNGERLEIIHRAHSRQAFVNGVLRAIRYIKHAKPGKISDMKDVLGLR
ncbi:dihydrodipicolinate reductase [Methanothermus fervidus DSM 2088]|uniref:4-hydroxy-tetrahydrodipicolinate reductase n=1 Tax=Methanothermus fervidus (strain ATCC 43054 / DSM 2088 / JCM 10308 / V24 S) TaxID=523846 RepID=E3GYU2_METFV|nr:dihydrodipicolinate reductase [Methanothermus fervidus DSM 2088]